MNSELYLSSENKINPCVSLRSLEMSPGDPKVLVIIPHSYVLSLTLAMASN